MKLLNFKAKEFACKCGCGLGDNILEMDLELLNVLESIREHIRANYIKDAVIIINSGIRCPIHNKAVGGAVKSQHLLGKASDIRVAGLTPKQLYDIINSLYPNKYGLGLYKTFVHIDVRSNKVRF